MSVTTRANSTEATRARARGGRLYPVLVPPPGSADALDRGCLCPVGSNLAGEYRPAAGWTVGTACKLHNGDVQWCATRGLAPAVDPRGRLRWVA